VTDWLSDKPIADIEAVSGEASALSDSEGKIVLTIDKDDDATEATINGAGYREETVALPEDNTQAQKVALVSGRKHAFVSKRSGKYELYKIDVDGKNEEIVQAATGKEQANRIIVSAHPSQEYIAYISTRDNKRNKEGYLLSNLQLIGLDDNQATSLTDSEDVQIIGWFGDRLVYRTTVAGASAANPKRQRIVSYDIKNAQSKEIATANYYVLVTAAGGQVYYAEPNDTVNKNNDGFYRIAADGSNKVAISQENIWDVSRTGYENFTLQTETGWLDYVLGENKTTKAAGEPSQTGLRVYVDSADRKHSLWVDTRDGKGVLLDYDVASKKDKTLKTASGISYPLRWLSANTVVYSIRTTQETADYVLNLDGGEAHKIKDVTSTKSDSGTYYY
jgi:Tol biopolymer transport system component